MNYKPFDVCLMKPPYAVSGSDTIHLKFVEKCLDLSKKQITVFPISFITKPNHKANNEFKPIFDKYLLSVDEYNSNMFAQTAMANVGVYDFDINKKQDDDIKINLLSKQYNTKSLLDINAFTDYEQHIIKYLTDNESQTILGDCGRLNKSKHWFNGLNKEQTDDLIKQLAVRSCKKIKQYYDAHETGYGLIVNRAYGGPGNTKYMSGKTGQIYSSYDEFLEFFVEHQAAIGYNVLMFDTLKGAKNCKTALQNPLLKLCLYRTQKDQNITRGLYKYVPAIDWADDRTKTDEGILMMCGCPKEKAAEYAAYCKKIIDEVDKK